MKKLKPDLGNALYIGTLCAVSYLAVYFARNILGAVTPQMIATGNFTDKYLGMAGSFFFIFYAVGQLINGMIGDKIKARYMLSFGLFFAGMTNLIFSLVTVSSPDAALVIYGMTGFFLAMIYGPMTKVVAENTDPKYTTRCSLGYTFASFFGSPTAGVVAGLMSWQAVFAMGSGVLFAMAVACFGFFLLFEKKGIVKYGQFKQEKADGQKRSFFETIKLLVSRQIIKFSLISMLTGVVRTAVIFWLPTYINQYLEFSEDQSTFIFSAATLVISLTAFISVFVYERLGNNMDKTILVMFTASAIFFALTFLIKTPILNICFITLAVMASNASATMLWSKYCPSLRDTGVVSSATGFLDFLSYMAAAISNAVFPGAVGVIGWKGLIAVWFGLMILGIAVALPYGKFKRAK